MTCQVKNGGAFLHVPKTGGSWVCAVLDRNGVRGVQLGPEHSTGHHEAWAFCVLRDPVEWWLSLWRFRNDTGHEHMDGAHPLYFVDSWHETDAATFITRAIEEGHGFCGRLYDQYVSRANYVLQTDKMEWHLPKLARRVGWAPLNLDLPPLNVSRPRALGQAAVDLLPTLRETESDAVGLWQRAATWN